MVRGVPGPIHTSSTTNLRRQPGMIERALRRYRWRRRLVVARVRDRTNDLPVPSRRGDGHSDELKPDLVLVAEDEAGQPVRATIVEVQCRPDPGKPLTVQRYLTEVEQVFGCPAEVAMVIPVPDTCTWFFKAFTPARRPMLIASWHIPKIRSLEQARACPEQSIVSALMHGRNDLTVARLGLQMALEHDELRTRANIRAILEVAREDDHPTLNQLMERMMQQRYEEHQDYELTEWEMQGGTYQKALRRGRQEGRQEGRQGLIAAVLDIVELRGLTLDAVTVAALRATRDLGRLDQWRARAKAARSSAELRAWALESFGDPH